MFGTIGRFHPKPDSEQKFRALMEEWERTMRPSIPGKVMQFGGRPKAQPDQVIFISLFQDEDTYRNLANNPDQDAFYRRMMECVDGEISWEDIQIDDVRQS